METKQVSPFARSPTLSTVLMVEEFIKKNSGEFNYTQIWKKLPKKVMWQTYTAIIEYLQSINKIALDKNGTIGYIWDSEAAKRFGGILSKHFKKQKLKNILKGVRDKHDRI